MALLLIFLLGMESFAYQIKEYAGRHLRPHLMLLLPRELLLLLLHLFFDTRHAVTWDHSCVVPGSIYAQLGSPAAIGALLLPSSSSTSTGVSPTVAAQNDIIGDRDLVPKSSLWREERAVVGDAV